MKFDLDINGELCDGELKYTDDMLLAYENKIIRYSVSISEIKHVKLTMNIGCAFLECKKNGDDFIICRFSMSCLKEAGEFAKALEYAIQNSTDMGFYESEITKVKESTECKKCGRKLVENTDTCFFCVDKLHIFRKAMKLLAEFRKPLLTSGLLLVLSNILYIVTPVINRILIDDYLRPKKGDAGDIAFWCGMIFALSATGHLIFIISSRISNRTSSGIANKLRCDLYKKVHQLSMSSMSKKTSGDLLKRIIQDTQKIRDFITDQGRWSFEQLTLFVVIAIILFATNPILTFMVFIPVPFALLVLNLFWRTIFIRYDRQWRLQARSNAILHDIIKGIRVVKTFGNEEREIDKFDKSCKVLAEVSASNEKLWARLFPVLGFVIGMGEFLVLYAGGKYVLGKQMSIGELVQFSMYMTYIYGPLRWMAHIPRWIADVAASLIKLFDILDEEPEIKDSKEIIEQDIKGSISFDNVVFGYKSYEPVLKNISFDIAQGEMIGIVGHSGAGKSTLINLVMRLYEANDGGITIDGNNIRNISQKTLHESIGAVFQENFLFVGSIYENIAYAKPDAAYEDVIMASKTANAHEFIIKLPDSYNTIVGENGYSLSGGERQRVAIARAVLRNPSILILDEATSSLDAETESSIQQALQRLAKGRTTIAIAHRLSTLKNANRLLVLDKGKLAEIGTHTELLHKKGIYYRLVMAQKGVGSAVGRH